MRGLSPALNGAVIDFDPFNTRTNADPTHEFGAFIEVNRGRDAYRHGGVGASNISIGKLQLAPAPVANHMNLALASTSNIAIGSDQISVTLAGTAATNSQYDQGKISVNAGTGKGQTLGVSHNPAQTTTTGTLLVTLDDPLLLALAIADSKVTLVHNAYAAVVEAASKTRTAAGVPLVSLLAGDFGWLKTKGVCGVLIGSAATLGARLTSDGSTAGAVTDNTDVSAPQTEVEVGQASIVAGTTGEYNPIVLSID